MASDHWIKNDKMPPAVARALQRAIAQTRWIITLRGLSATLGLGLAAFFAVMLADSKTVFMDAWPRWILSGLAYGIMAFSAYWFLIRPLRRSFSMTGMARIIEQRHPELQERLSSIVNLTSAGASAEWRGSEALIQALAGQAQADVESVHPSDAASVKAIKPWLAAAAGLFALLGLLLAVKPHETAVLLGRAVFPMANLSNLSALQLEVKPGDARVGEGRPLTLSVTAPGRRGQDAVLYVTPSTTRREAQLTLNRSNPGPDGRITWSATLDSVQSDFKYRIRMDRAVTRFFKIQSVPPPVIRSLAVHYAFPGYTGLPDREVMDQGGSLHAVEHTRLQLLVAVNKPIAKPEWVLTGSHPMVITGQVERTEAGGNLLVFALDLKPGMNGLGSLVLTDEYGFSNPPWQRTVQAIPDAKPALKVLFPDKAVLRLSRLESLPLLCAAADDFGFTRGEWRLDPKPRPGLVHALEVKAVSNRPPLVLQDAHSLPLSDSAMTGAVQVVVTFHAADNRDAACGGPQWSASPPVTILFDEAALSVEEQALAAQEAFVRLQLETAKKELTAARDQLKPAAEQLARPETVDSALLRVEEARKHAAEADKNLNRLSEAARDGYLESVAKQAEAIARDPVAEAEKTLDRLPLEADPGAKSATATQALAFVQAALDQVQALSSNALQTASAVRQALVLKDLAEREERRADAAKTGTDPVAVEKERRQVSERLGAVMKDLPAEAVAAALREQLQEAVKAAEAIAEEQQKVVLDSHETLKPGHTEQAALQKLIADQDALAREAQSRPETAPAVPDMQEAAAALKRDELKAALDRQNKVLKALRAAADSKEGQVGLEAETEAGARAAVEAKAAELAAKRADEAAASLERVQARLDEAAHDQAAGAEKSGKMDPRLPSLAHEAKKAASEASDLADEADRKAVQALREAETVRASADPAEQEKALAQTAESAGEAEKLAKQAENLLNTIQKQAVPVLAPRDQAERLEERARQAATRAEQAATLAEQVKAGAPETARAKDAAQKAAVAAEQVKQGVAEARKASGPEAVSKALIPIEKKTAEAEKEADKAEQALASVRREGLTGKASNERKKEAERQADESAGKAREAVSQAQDAVKRARQAEAKVEKADPVAEEVKTLADAAAYFGEKAAASAQAARESAKQVASSNTADEKNKALDATQEKTRETESAARSAEKFADQAERAAEPALTDANRADRAAAAARQDAQESRKAAGEVAALADSKPASLAKPLLSQLKEQAGKAAGQAEQASLKASQAAAVAKKAETPNAAKELRAKAEAAAQEARAGAEMAEQASALAKQAAARSAEPVARARLAGEAAEQAARNAENSVEQARQGAGPTPQPPGQEAMKAADQAARESRQAAQQAKQAADEAARASSVKDAEAKAEQAERAAVQAIEQAGQARSHAREAVAAEKPKTTPDQAAEQRKQLAVLEAGQAAAEAKAQAAEAAQAAERAGQAAAQALVEAQKQNGKAGEESLKPRLDQLSEQAAQAANAARTASQAAQRQAQEAAKLQEAAAQSASPSAATAKAVEAEGKAFEAERLATQAGRMADRAQASVDAQKAAEGRDLAGRQRELAAQTRDALAEQELAPEDQWQKVSDRQQDVVEAAAGLKDDLTQARAMAEQLKKPDQTQALDRGAGQAAEAVQSAQAAAKAMDAAARASEGVREKQDAQAKPADLAAARQAADKAGLQADLQAEATAAVVTKAMENARQQATAALSKMVEGVPAGQTDPGQTSSDQEEEDRKAAQTMAEAIPDALSALQKEARNAADAESADVRDPLNQAAQAAKERAEALGGKPSAGYPRLEMPSGGGGGERKEGDEVVPEGEGGYATGRLRDWFRRSGDLGGTVMDSAEDGEPEDYRGLIRKYFEEVSRRSHED